MRGSRERAGDRRPSTQALVARSEQLRHEAAEVIARSSLNRRRSALAVGAATRILLAASLAAGVAGPDRPAVADGPDVAIAAEAREALAGRA